MLNVDPKNLRGIGIQVAKLDKPNEPTKGQNKSILNFLTAKSPVKPPVVVNNSQEPGPSNAFISNPTSTTEVCTVNGLQVNLSQSRFHIELSFE